MHENDIATVIVDCAYKIHTTLGPGLLESVYEKVLACELSKRGHTAVVEQAIPVVYETSTWRWGFAPTLSWKGKSSWK